MSRNESRFLDTDPVAVFDDSPRRISVSEPWEAPGVSCWVSAVAVLEFCHESHQWHVSGWEDVTISDEPAEFDDVTCGRVRVAMERAAKEQL